MHQSAGFGGKRHGHEPVGRVQVVVTRLIDDSDKATRKKKPKILAITTDCCTGCAGSPACIEYCPIEACMFWVPDEDHPPFGRIEVDPNLCIGCQKCISKGPDGAFLDGCPWDAIEMVPTEDWEAIHGIELTDAPLTA